MSDRDASADGQRHAPPSRRPRWWIALAIVLLSAVALAWIWGILETPRQDRVIKTTAVLSATGLALLLWTVLLSRFKLRTRIEALVASGVVIGLFHLLFVVRDFTGDLVPIVEWRFARRGEPAADVNAETASAAHAEQAWQDSPQFLGPARDATWPHVELERDLVAHPPRLLWTREVAAGWSGFAVRGADAITQEQRGDQECVVCYDVASGTLRWLHATPARYDKPVGGVGPRATPTITKDHVFTLGATGVLTCLRRADGALAWSRDTLADHGATANEWGVSHSPLVHGDLVIVGGGGGAGARSVIAYLATTGAPAWSGGADPAGYASPQLATVLGEAQIVSFNRRSTSGHAPATGALLWSFPWSHEQPNVAQPRMIGDAAILVSAGYGKGCARFAITRGDEGAFVATQVWKTLALKAKFANFVIHDGHAFGIDDGILACVDLESGARRWKGGRHGHGQLLRAGDTLLVTAEFGDVILVAASPHAYQELARFQAFDEKSWNTPCFAPPLLLLRTDRQAACYELTLRGHGAADAGD